MKFAINTFASKFLLTCCLAAIVACGDSENTNSGSNVGSDMPGNIASLDQLPDCTADQEGIKVFVVKEQSDFVCRKGRWLKIGEKTMMKM